MKDAFDALLNYSANDPGSEYSEDTDWNGGVQI